LSSSGFLSLTVSGRSCRWRGLTGQCPLQVPPILRFYFSDKLLAVLVAGRSGDNAFCNQYPSAARLAGLTEVIGLRLKVSIGSRSTVLKMLSHFNHAATMRSMVAVIAGKCSGYGVFGKFITYEAVGVVRFACCRRKFGWAYYDPLCRRGGGAAGRRL